MVEQIVKQRYKSYEPGGRRTPVGQLSQNLRYTQNQTRTNYDKDFCWKKPEAMKINPLTNKREFFNLETEPRISNPHPMQCITDAQTTYKPLKGPQQAKARTIKPRNHIKLGGPFLSTTE